MLFAVISVVLLTWSSADASCSCEANKAEIAKLKERVGELGR